jgi:hypothetical protein
MKKQTLKQIIITSGTFTCAWAILGVYNPHLKEVFLPLTIISFVVFIWSCLEHIDSKIEEKSEESENINCQEEVIE